MQLNTFGLAFDMGQDNDDPAQLHIDKHNQLNIKEKYNLFFSPSIRELHKQ
jgi:hypothetical protein